MIDVGPLLLTSAKRAGGRAVAAIAAVLLAGVLVFQVRQILTASVLYDDAFIATAAKNLAHGFGYSTFYPNLVNFDPEISTGPAIVLPTALLISWLGNNYWVPNLSITLCSWLTLGLMVRVLTRHLRGPSLSIALSLIALTFMVYATEEYGLLGELPAAFLVGTAALLACSEDSTTRPQLFWSGVALGCAIECKLIAVLVIFAVPVFALPRRPESRTARALVAWGSGLMLPVVAWQVCQYLMVRCDSSTWLAVKRQELLFLLSSQSLSGIGDAREASNLPAHVTLTVLHNAQSLWGIVGSWPYLAAFLVTVVVSAFVAGSGRDRPGRPSVHQASRLLILAGCIHCGWWLAVSPTGWARHLLPGILYFCFAVSFLIARNSTSHPRVAAACVLLLMVSWFPRRGFVARVPLLDFHKSSRLVALLATRDDVLDLQRHDDIVLVGWDWWVPRDVDYLMPSSGTFKDLNQLTPDALAGKRIVLVRNEFFNWEHSERLDELRALCDRRILFHLEPFVISECPGHGQ